MMAKLATSLLTALSLSVCVPAQIDVPDAVTGELVELQTSRLAPALSDAQLSRIDFVVVLPPLCRQPGAPPPLLLGRRIEPSSRPPTLPASWRDLCSRRPMVVTARTGSSFPAHEFPLTRSGHLSVRVPPVAPATQSATRMTSSDLVGLREQLDARPDWHVVDEVGFAAWLGVDADYVRPGRPHAMPLDGHSWFVEEAEDTDPRSGCPLRALVESRWLYLFDGRDAELLAGPPIPVHGVLEHWHALLEREHPPLLLADSPSGMLGWQVVGNQLVDHPRCTTGELAIAARWVEAHRRTLPRRAHEPSQRDYVAWLYEAHARVGSPPSTMPELAWLMRRMYLMHVHLQVMLAPSGSGRDDALAAIAAWWRDPANLERQPQVLCDMATDEALDRDDPLAAALFERVFPQLLADDAAWWQALAAEANPAFDASRRARARRDAFMLGYASELPSSSRRVIAQLCAAWHAVGHSPGEPRPCTPVGLCDESPPW